MPSQTFNPQDLFLTGGSGRLGTEVLQYFPEAMAPRSAEFNILNPNLEKYMPKVVLHMAAYTDVLKAEKEKIECWDTNVIGTERLSKECERIGAILVHISTDYVFSGTQGYYHESDIPLLTEPVNWYGKTKLMAEQVVNGLIVRTTFRCWPWPYDKAPTDCYTSQDYVKVIAKEISILLENVHKVPDKIIHIGTERKSVYELAKRSNPDISPCTRADLPVSLPFDTSLNINRWESLKREWS